MQKKYFIQTFGCQMNQADSEKVNMVLLQCGFVKSPDISSADIVIFNTCSVRQKGEDRVFGIIHEIEKLNKQRAQKNQEKILVAITGCMVRKTGIAKRYIEKYSPQTSEKSEKQHISDTMTLGKIYEPSKRKTAKKIEYIKHLAGIFNTDDKLFPRSSELDFTFRIEETKYVPHILSHIYGKKIGQEDKFDDYLKQIQQRENPFSASVIIQTGCDNYCSFCIVPYTRGAETSRNQDEILEECRKAVASGAKEITLLGQNVNSYGKQKNLKFWNQEKSKWNEQDQKLKIGIDLDETLFIVLCEEIIQEFNRAHNEILKVSDVLTYNLNGDSRLENIYKNYEEANREKLPLQPGALEILTKLKSLGHELYVITSREIQHKEKTQKYLSHLFGENFFNEIIFVRENYNDCKYLAANTLGLDVVVDDGDHHIDGYKEHFSGKIVVYHQNWNTRFEQDSKKLFRISTWYDFEGILPKLRFTSPFRNLLQEIDTIEGLERIRFTSSNPHDMTRDILDAHFELKNTCNYLHFALQSGSNEMLKRMNRRHSYEDFRAMVKYLRKKDPLFSISTDIIVGFSGETEEMFADTVRAFKECAFDFCYTARYSVRKGTLAEKVFPDDVPDKIKAERWHILNNLLLENILKRNFLMIGKVFPVFIVGEKDGLHFGRTRNYKEVFFEKREENSVGDIVPVRITECDYYVLRGILE